MKEPTIFEQIQKESELFIRKRSCNQQIANTILSSKQYKKMLQSVQTIITYNKLKIVLHKNPSQFNQNIMSKSIIANGLQLKQLANNKQQINIFRPQFFPQFINYQTGTINFEKEIQFCYFVRYWL